MNDTSSGVLAEQQFVRILRDKGWDAWRIEGPGPDVVGLHAKWGSARDWGDSHIMLPFYFEVKATKRKPTCCAIDKYLRLKAPVILVWRIRGGRLDPGHFGWWISANLGASWTTLEEWVP